MIDNIKNKIKKIVFGMKNIFIDKDVAKIYSQGFVSLCPQILIKAGTSEIYTIKI